jgi:hypothetical protein
MKINWSVLYLFVLCLWVGGVVLFTFIVTPAIFRSYGRDVAGDLVGRLFPPYFTYVFALSLAALVLFLLGEGIAAALQSRICIALLIAAIAINAYTLFKLHPDMVAVKKQIASFEREPKDSPARKEFSRQHAISATLNLLALADGVVLLIIKASGK